MEIYRNKQVIQELLVKVDEHVLIIPIKQFLSWHYDY